MGIVIDEAKLREAITIQDKPVLEKMANTDEAKTPELPNIPLDIPEEEFLVKAEEAIGALKKTSRKTLEKESFIKVFKYMGDFNKMKTRELKKTSQSKRCESFEKDAKLYMEALKAGVQEEEKAFEGSSRIMFDKLCITQECFERTQQELMNDPYVSMQLFNLGITMEQPSIDAPESLTAEKTVNINHKFTEEEFKAALFQHKIYENPEISNLMQHKQMELMMLAAQQNPMMMQQLAAMGGGGMGGF